MYADVCMSAENSMTSSTIKRLDRRDFATVQSDQKYLQETKMNPPSFICYLIILLPVGSFGHIEKEEDCTKCVMERLEKQPSLDQRFSRHQLCQLCLQRQAWMKKVDERKAKTQFNGLVFFAVIKPVDPDWTFGQQQYIDQLQKCQGRTCLDWLPEDKRSPSRRQEYRAMSMDERNRFHKAIQQTKREQIDGISKYDMLVKCHKAVFAPAAHGGPAFLPFHREFLKQMELSLRLVDPDVSLPYWDSTLDQGLPNPLDSIMWTQDFVGEHNGMVITGPFRNWSAPQKNYPEGDYLSRKAAIRCHNNEGLYKPSDIDIFLNYTNFSQFDTCTDVYFEGVHGDIHTYIGGHLGNVEVSPFDPVFFLHHCFIDFIWEKFRDRQTHLARLTEYPSIIKCDNSDHHQGNATMHPFPIRNIDGLSDAYAELSRYEERPQCNQHLTACVPNSPYLFCDKWTKRCLSKIRPDGNCWGLHNQDACYKSTCVDGVCK